MIKLNWYALTKPHVVHRYYRIKERCKMLDKTSHRFMLICYGPDSDGKPTITKISEVIKCENTK